MSTRAAIWTALLHSARWERYYAIRASRFRRWEMAIRFVLLGSAMGAITSFLAETPAALRIASGVFIALVVAYDFAVEPARNAATLALIRDECGRLKLALSDLWQQQPSLADEEARRLLTELNSNLHNITAKDQTATSNRINEQTTDAVFAEAKRMGYVT